MLVPGWETLERLTFDAVVGDGREEGKKSEALMKKKKDWVEGKEESSAQRSTDDGALFRKIHQHQRDTTDQRCDTTDQRCDTTDERHDTTEV